MGWQGCRIRKVLRSPGGELARRTVRSLIIPQRREPTKQLATTGRAVWKCATPLPTAAEGEHTQARPAVPQPRQRVRTISRTRGCRGWPQPWADHWEAACGTGRTRNASPHQDEEAGCRMLRRATAPRPNEQAGEKPALPGCPVACVGGRLAWLVLLYGPGAMPKFPEHWWRWPLPVGDHHPDDVAAAGHRPADLTPRAATGVQRPFHTM